MGRPSRAHAYNMGAPGWRYGLFRQMGVDKKGIYKEDQRPPQDPRAEYVTDNAKGIHGLAEALLGA